VRVLVLGGTGEARALAAELVGRGVDVLSSLAGRVSAPRLPAGPVRIGGFGGVDGLADFLATDRISAVVDATHPFAATISASAATATARLGMPLLMLLRPAWPADPDWTDVADMPAAAAAVARWPGERVLLTTGRRDLAVFADDEKHEYVVRVVDPPDGPVPTRMTVLRDRGPYTVEGERQLLRENGIGLMVSKNSGGAMTEAKLRAARAEGVTVVMVRRPPAPAGVRTVDSVAAVLEWLSRGTGAG
jgi:precorrin-6A/cobalt-precorrin-6A reductase